MAIENVQANSGTGGAKFATDQITEGVDTLEVPYAKLMSGTDASKELIGGDATNGLDVDVTRLPALPAGTNNIGDVDVLTLPALPAGTNNIGDVDVLTLPATTNAGATVKTTDYDTGAGTDTVTMFGVALPASGGAVAGGTATNPIRVDPTGTTAQPVTDNGSTLSIDDGAGSLTVDNAALSVTGGGLEASALRVTIASDSTGLISVDDNGSSLTIDGSVSITGALPAGTNNIGDVDVLTLPALPAGTNNIGDVDVLTLPALTTGTNTIGAVNVKPATSGGLTISRTISAASTNATSVKASAGQIFGWYISNVNAAARFVKLYNKASAPTVGTDTPVMTIVVPGNTAGAGTNIEFTNGIAFGTGIALAITGAVTDADTTAVATNEIVVNLLYA